MKILVLEHPRLPSTPHFNDIANTPLWSCVMAGYVYSALQDAGFSPLLLDANEHGLDFKQTEGEILTFNPDLLTINAVYFWEHTGLFFDMLNDLRKKGFTGIINLFGFFPTLHYDTLLKQSAVDSIAVGECEQTIVSLAQHLNTTKKIVGLATQKHPFTPRKQIQDLDSIAFPQRTKTQLKQTISILASRGCYNHCSFCPIPSFYNDGPLWRGRSMENIMAEISPLARQGIRQFYFIDPNFIGPGTAGRRRVLDLLAQLKPLNITFGMETRATDLDDELMQRLVDAGLTSLLMGVESGSSDGLAHFDKNETVHDSEKAITICRAAGIEPEIGFLMFTPDSTQTSLLDNITFLEHNNLLDRLDRTANLLCHSQIIMAGTSGFRQYQARGILQTEKPLQFIGRVGFQNKQVSQSAAAVIALCHFILRETGEKDSALYFKTARYSEFTTLNALLVEEVKQYILQPEGRRLNESLQKLRDCILHHTVGFPVK